MQTGSSETLIGWKSGKTTYVHLWDRMEGPVLFWTPAILLLANIASSMKIMKIMLILSF
jgi:hypothetical protein